jgi:hypothetical protein
MEPDLDRPTTRRQFLKGAGVLAGLGVVGTAVGAGIWRSVSPDEGAKVATRVTGPPSLDELAANIVSGGPPKDGIPPIDRPRLISASQARFLSSDDVVFGLVHRGEVRAYPQLVLVWHEIANDVIGGERLSVTYCPLTGSVVAFTGRMRGRPLTFGTTGKLVNSNLLMYDRVTDSEWPQVLGTAISGAAKRQRLTEIPLVWSTWGRWRAVHPDTAVLSTETGHLRDYGRDPYGSYDPLRGYYAGGRPFFPVLAESDRFGSKEVVVGVKAGDARLAVRKRRIERARNLPLSAGGTPLLAIWDDNLATPRVFLRRARGRTLHFHEGEHRDAAGSTWDPTGRATDGPLAGAQLPPATFFDVMWFAWYAFYPDTGVVA